MKRHKAPGLSGLVAEMIQATRDIGTQWILDLRNGIMKNSELKRICYKEPFRGNSDCLATYAGWTTSVFRIVDRMNERGRLFREWLDDIDSWRKTGLQELNSLAQDR